MSVSNKNINITSANKIKALRKKSISTDSFIKGILNNDKAILSMAITLIESTNKQEKKRAQEIIKKCLSQKSDSIRIGITGVPGVGKSTFIEALGNELCVNGKKIAVLTVDPSSSISKGSILGDKTRMSSLSKNTNAFIRPSPSGEALGGIGRKTREAIILCEAAGYDIILIETVGVGQSETLVHSMVDFFLLLKLSGAGDELQGIKRGIIELADAIIINKADQDNIKQSKLAQSEFKRVLHLYPIKKSGWTPKVLLASAMEKKGITETWEMIISYISLCRQNGYFIENRKSQNKNWVTQTIEQQLKIEFHQHIKVKQLLPKILNKVSKSEISPFNAAEELLLLYRNK